MEEAESLLSMFIKHLLSTIKPITTTIPVNNKSEDFSIPGIVSIKIASALKTPKMYFSASLYPF